MRCMKLISFVLQLQGVLAESLETHAGGRWGAANFVALARLFSRIGGEPNVSS